MGLIISFTLRMMSEVAQLTGISRVGSGAAALNPLMVNASLTAAAAGLLRRNWAI